MLDGSSGVLLTGTGSGVTGFLHDTPRLHCYFDSSGFL